MIEKSRAAVPSTKICVTIMVEMLFVKIFLTKVRKICSPDAVAIEKNNSSQSTVSDLLREKALRG